MKKIKVKATRIDEYEISIDPEVWDDQALADWSSVFHKIETVEELAESLAFAVLRFGSGSFMEGFGHVRTLMRSGYDVDQYKRGKDGEILKLAEEDYCKGILVQLVDEDEEHEFEVEEIVNG